MTRTVATKETTVTLTLTDVEARLLGAMLTGECSYNFFVEGGDYPVVMSVAYGLKDRCGFVRKLDKLF